MGCRPLLHVDTARQKHHQDTLTFITVPPPLRNTTASMSAHSISNHFCMSARTMRGLQAEAFRIALQMLGSAPNKQSTQGKTVLQLLQSLSFDGHLMDDMF